MMCMGKVDLAVLADKNHEEDDHHDEDIYDGTYLTPHGGAARVAYHSPTNTLCLIASKTAANLKGGSNEGGDINATEEGLSRSYIIAAYRLKEDGSNFDRVKLKLRESLQSYDLELGKRAKKHFGQFAASFRLQQPINVDAQDTGYVEVFTNGYAAYLLKRKSANPDNSPPREECSADFHASVRRQEGHFEPINFKGTFWSSRISRISKEVASQGSYGSVRHTIDEHWGRVSSKLWDQESLYSGEGMTFQMKRARADFVNYVNDSKKHILPTAAVVGGVFAKNPALGVKAAVSLTVGHILMHKIADGGLHGFMHTFQKVREARKRTNIEDYDFGEDASDYFKIHTKNNLSAAKIAPKICMDRFDAGDFSFLNSEQSGLMYNHQQVVDGLRPEDVRSLLLFGHQRGFTSTVGFLDKSTRFDAFQNGIMRVMHNQPDGKVVVHAQYQPELCTNDALRLPDVYIDQFEGGIIRLEYDPEKENFGESIAMETNVPRRQAIHEISHTQLFRNQAYTDKAVQQRSHDIVPEILIPIRDPNPYEDTNIEEVREKTYRGGRPFNVPDADAIISNLDQD